MEHWGPKHVQPPSVTNKLNHKTLCILLVYIYITRWYTVHTISRSVLSSHCTIPTTARSESRAIKDSIQRHFVSKPAISCHTMQWKCENDKHTFTEGNTKIVKKRHEKYTKHVLNRCNAALIGRCRRFETTCAVKDRYPTTNQYYVTSENSEYLNQTAADASNHASSELLHAEFTGAPTVFHKTSTHVHRMLFVAESKEEKYVQATQHSIIKTDSYPLSEDITQPFMPREST